MGFVAWETKFEQVKALFVFYIWIRSFSFGQKLSFPFLLSLLLYVFDMNEKAHAHLNKQRLFKLFGLKSFHFFLQLEMNITDDSAQNVFQNY